GYNALLVNAAGKCNTAVGTYNLQANTTGCRNTAIGYNVLAQKVDGCNNIGIGTGVLAGIGDSDNNIAMGCSVLSSNTTGSDNTAIGTGSQGSNVSGAGNTSLGYLALLQNATGDNNVAIGRCAGSTSGAFASNKLYIANCGDCSLISGDFTGKTVTIDGATHLCYTLGVSGATTLGTVASGATSDPVLTITSGGVVQKIAATSLGEDNNRYETTGLTNSTINLYGGEYVVLVNPTAPTTVYLPAAPDTGTAFKIKDYGPNALANNITIDGNGKDIDGNGTALINTNYGAIELVYNGTAWFILSFVN
ncbi:unnamed protein product, partial [marine sediment metagenome]